MAISAERFKFLDRETNLATKEFTNLTDNQIYNTSSSVIDTYLEEIKNSNNIVMGLGDSLLDLKSLVENNAITESIKNALNSAIDTISKMELPGIVKDLFNTLKELDLGGIKDFLKDLLHVGATFLCNNLDFIKMFMLGYALNKNILSGLLIALLMTWLDRFCKGFSSDDVDTSSNLEKLEMLIPPRGVEMNTSNTFTNFTQTYSDYLNATSTINTSTPYDSATFLSKVITGDTYDAVNNLRESEISNTEKNTYLSLLNNELNNYQPGSYEYSNILKARGDISNIPLISTSRRDVNINYSNLSDRLGSMSKNLLQVDLSSINKFTFNDLEKGLNDKIAIYKNSVSNNQDLYSRGLNSGSYDTFDFSSILPELTPEETEYISNLNGSNSSHRVHDIHPTSSVFFGV